jgi:hypothetical protein
VSAEYKQQGHPASSSWPEHVSSSAGAAPEYTPFTSTGLAVLATEDTHNGNSDTTIDELEIMISLRIDDLHGTFDDAVTLLLHTKLEGELNTMKKETDSFRHEGLDIQRDISTKHIILTTRIFESTTAFTTKGQDDQSNHCFQGRQHFLSPFGLRHGLG